MAAGAENVFNLDEEEFREHGTYSVHLLNAIGDQIFANPNQLNQALNANATFGGGFEYVVLPVILPGDRIAFRNDIFEIGITRNAPYTTPPYNYNITVFDDDEAEVAEYGETTQEFRNKMNTLKTIIENLGNAAGAARRRKNRKTKKTSRRRRITRRRY